MLMALLLATCVCNSLFDHAMAESASDEFAVPENVQAVFANRCLGCHSSDMAEGDVRLDTLARIIHDL